MAYDVTKVKTPEDLARAAIRLCDTLRRSLAIMKAQEGRLVREVAAATAALNALQAQPDPDPAEIKALEEQISDLHERRLELQAEILLTQDLIDEFC